MLIIQLTTKNAKDMKKKIKYSHDDADKTFTLLITQFISTQNEKPEFLRALRELRGKYK